MHRDSPLRNVNLSRRAFIFAGVAGATMLAASRWLTPSAAPRKDSLRALDADGEAIVAALVPVMLAGALPAAPDARRAAIVDTVDGVDRAILGLPPLARDELGQLFVLLALAPTRWALAHTTSSWNDASASDIEAFLQRLRDSRIGLLRAAYDALHQLIFASWYGNPRAWAAIGYGGPPRIG